MNDVHPDFRNWLAKQPEAVRDAIRAFHSATAHDPGIVHGHRNAAYARASKTIAYAVAEHGYVG